MQVQIKQFEGPLGLLLYLIKKDEMDVFDINVHQITSQYLGYIKTMKKLDLEVAGEFIAMAATLIHIKSRMLLPQYNEEGEVVESDDPRRELVQKLLEYQRFQEASDIIYSRPLVGRDTWLRGTKEVFEAEESEDDIEIEDNPLYALIKSYRYVIKASKRATHKVFKELKSISQRVAEIKTIMMVGKRIIFDTLIDRKNLKGDSLRDQILITFLSMLELGKLGFVRVYQSAPFEDIHVDTVKTLDENFIDQADSYSYVNNTPSAEALFSQNEDILTEEIPVDLSSDQSEFDLEDDPDEGDETIEDLPIKVEDQSFVVEAATDDEIIAEEILLDIVEGEPLVDQEIITDMQLDETKDGEL